MALLKACPKEVRLLCVTLRCVTMRQDIIAFFVDVFYVEKSACLLHDLVLTLLRVEHEARSEFSVA